MLTRDYESVFDDPDASVSWATIAAAMAWSVLALLLLSPALLVLALLPSPGRSAEDDPVPDTRPARGPRRGDPDGA